MKKKLALFAALFFCTSYAMAAFEVWKASVTATADTAQTLCAQSRHSIFHGVCVGGAGPGGRLTFVDSRGGAVALSTMAVISSTSAVVSGCLYYDIQASSGITYTSSVASDITILYQCF